MNSVCFMSKDRVKRWQNFRRELHREKGPALEYPNGDKEWWLNGQKHRTDGPAVERANGKVEWYYYNTKVDCTNLAEFTRLIKLHIFW